MGRDQSLQAAGGGWNGSSVGQAESAWCNCEKTERERGAWSGKIMQ